VRGAPFLHKNGFSGNIVSLQSLIADQCLAPGRVQAFGLLSKAEHGYDLRGSKVVTRTEILGKKFPLLSQKLNLCRILKNYRWLLFNQTVIIQ
jgi:hypothetical protein